MEVETSPLQPHAFRHPSWTFGKENSASPSRSLAMGSSMFGPKLNANVAKGDYFDMDSKMMSSPTSTLAADLSKNFHIDKTPMIPTPRRSLFSAALANTRPLVTTPPIPASSPGNDSMDISPLPHKAPFNVYRSPLTPTADGGMDISLCSSPPNGSPLDPARRPNLAERKKSAAMSRTSLLRQSNRLSSNSIIKSRTSPIPFTGSCTTAPQIKLEELFGGASPECKKTGTLGLGFLAPPTPRPFALGTDQDGSPIAPLNRQARPSFQRPKGKVRRTLSMFEHAQDVMQEDAKDEEGKLNPSPKADPGENSYLPCFNVKDDPLRRITRETLCDVLDEQYKEHYDDFMIVDCRFEYEYEGGHISGAANVNSIDTLEDKFFTAPQETRQLIIFHCEYSAHRAPRMALHLRKRDRQLNMHRYPALHYPDIYILEGGYSSFFNQHRMRCEPQHYVEMSDEKHKRTCEREMGKFRRNTKFNRTQSFTFGAQPEGHDSSPSAGIASRRPAGCGEQGGLNLISTRQRRMASY